MIAAVAAIVVVALGFQFQTKFKSKKARCTQNMKDIALGYNLWLSDHEAKRLPWMLNAGEGGNLDLDPALRRQSWFQFSWISNELSSPKALADPADKRKELRVAKSWNSSPTGGFFHPSFRNNACSYGLALDALYFGTGPALDDLGPTLAFDRHIVNDGGDDCRFVPGVMVLKKPYKLKWRDEVHGKAGGFLALLDGSARFVRSNEPTKGSFFNFVCGADPAKSHILLPE